MTDWDKERDNLYNYIFVDKMSYKAISKLYGCSCQNIRKVAIKLGFNLRLVCPNCDSQLDTYKAKNIGKSTRKYKPYRLFNL